MIFMFPSRNDDGLEKGGLSSPMLKIKGENVCMIDEGRGERVRDDYLLPCHIRRESGEGSMPTSQRQR